jgi:LmbE family N-acetylglucosaminyl deacetylase
MKLLFVVAHPHYASTYCAGTIANHTQRGDTVTVVSVTAGELMTNRVNPKELAKINKKDMEASAEVLGIAETRILGYPDAGISNSTELRMDINNAIREFTPDLVITHWPKDTHPDFHETGQAAVDSCFFALLVSGKWIEKHTSHWTSRAYGFQYPGLSVGFKPSLLVDVTEVLQIKIKAMDVFKIHVEANFGGDFEKYRSSILGPSRYWGVESGVMYAEPYARIDIHEVHNKAVKHLI